jgi:16S rRNA (guanine527-N7)-methyltransferase
MDDLDIKKRIEKGLEQLHWTSFEGISVLLYRYLLLLDKWNQTYNLTAIRTPDAMVSKHLLDSLAILPWVKGPRILDVGTGAGLPGIPLAIAQPESHFTLLDSNGKKIRFLEEVKDQLQLKNIELVQIRVESYHPAQGFDTVISRAFNNLEQMIHWTQHLIHPKGIWLAMKGATPHAELEKIPFPFRVEHYQVPYLEGERCCIHITKEQTSWRKS